MKKFLLLICFCTSMYYKTAAQQDFTIEGRVVDAQSNPIAGASVRLLNTNRQALADAQGNFSIRHAQAGTATLEVTAVGYAGYAAPVTANNTSGRLSVTLQRKSKQLDEVVVTAQKQEELLQQLPVSVTSISAAQVQEYRLWNSKDITGIVPNLYSSDPGDKRNVTSIRGIATTSYDPAVATYIDGVNQFGLDTYIAQLFDVDHIEILRGPQGTLYGRNALGGVINIVTKRPTNNTSGFGEISIGNKGQQRYSAGVRVPLVKDKLFVGIAGLYDHLNGFYFNDFNRTKYDRQKNITGNYYIKYLPGDRWALTLNLKHSNNINHGPFPLVFGVSDAFSQPYRLSQNATTRMNDNTGNASLSAAYNGRHVSFTSQTAYQSNYRIYKTPIDADFSPIDGITLINNYGKDWNKVKVWTQEFKFSSADAQSPFRWTAGAYLFHQDNPVKQATRFGEDAALVSPGITDKNFSTINSSKGKSTGVAIYGQATYTISSKLDLTAGLRYDYERKKQAILGEFQQDPNPNPVFAYRSDTSGKANFSALSPKLNLGYHASKSSLLFVSYSRGYRAGGLTPLSSDPSQLALYAFKPEYSNNIEAGIKNTLFQQRLLLNITAFYTNVTDAQVPTLVLPAATVITRNTGKLRSRGVELEMAATPAEGLELNYSFGYNDAKYTTLKLAQGGAEVNLEGKYQLFTPDVTSMLAVQYGLSVDRSKKQARLIVRGEWRYLGRQYFDLSNSLKQSSYALFNTRFGLEAKQFSLMLWGRNLAGKKYIAYAYDFGAVHLGDPRTYGATLQVRL